MKEEQKFFKNGKKAPPRLLQRTIKPDFSLCNHPLLEKEKFWTNQKQRWIEGTYVENDYGAWQVPGLSIFCYDQIVIKNRNSGKPEPYDLRDGSLLLHQTIVKNFADHFGTAVLKARLVGFSTDLYGGFPFWLWKTNPGASISATAKNNTLLAELYKDKTTFAGERLDRDIIDFRKRTKGKRQEDCFGDILLRNATKDSAYVQVELKYKNDMGDPEEITSQMSFVDTNQSLEKASGFSGTGALALLFDEFFLHKYPAATIQSAISTLLNPSTKQLNAYMVCGGTCENTVSAENLAILYTLWRKLEALSLRPLFLPAYYGYECVNGWSDIEAWYEMDEKEREKFEKLKDKEGLIAHCKNHCRTEDDVWQFAKSANFEQDVAEKIEQQIKVAQLSTEYQARKITLNNVGGKVELTNGYMDMYEMIEPVRPGVLYYATLDGTATGSLAGAPEGSKAAGFILKGLDATSKIQCCPVMWWIHRPQRVIDSHRAVANMIRYYDKFGGFRLVSAEANASTSEYFTKFLLDEGMGRFILYTANGKPFIPRLTQFIEAQFLWANEFLRNYVHNFYCLPLLHDLAGKEGKGDAMDSFLMGQPLFPKGFDKVPEKVMTRKIEKQVLKRIRGRVQWVTEYRTIHL